MQKKHNTTSTEAVRVIASLDELSTGSHSDSSSDSSSDTSSITAPPVSPLTSAEDLSPASCEVTSEDMSDEDDHSGA